MSRGQQEMRGYDKKNVQGISCGKHHRRAYYFVNKKYVLFIFIHNNLHFNWFIV